MASLFLDVFCIFLKRSPVAAKQAVPQCFVRVISDRGLWKDFA